MFVPLRPFVVLRGIVNEHRRLGDCGEVDSCGVCVAFHVPSHAPARMFHKSRHVGLYRGEHVSVAESKAERSRTSHRIAAKIYAVSVYGVFHHRLLDCRKKPPFTRRERESRILVRAPPPIRRRGHPAIKIEGIEIVGGAIDVVVARRERAIKRLVRVVAGGMQHDVQRASYSVLVRHGVLHNVDLLHGSVIAAFPSVRLYHPLDTPQSRQRIGFRQKEPFTRRHLLHHRNQVGIGKGTCGDRRRNHCQKHLNVFSIRKACNCE